MSTNHILIIALSNHPVLGPLLIPYFAKTVSQDVISVEEQATHAGNDTELSEMEKRVIAIAQKLFRKEPDAGIFQATDGGRLFEFGDGGDVEEATPSFH